MSTALTFLDIAIPVSCVCIVIFMFGLSPKLYADAKVLAEWSRYGSPAEWYSERMYEERTGYVRFRWKRKPRFFDNRECLWYKSFNTIHRTGDCKCTSQGSKQHYRVRSSGTICRHAHKQYQFLRSWFDCYDRPVSCFWKGNRWRQSPCKWWSWRAFHLFCLLVLMHLFDVLQKLYVQCQDIQSVLLKHLIQGNYIKKSW